MLIIIIIIGRLTVPIVMVPLLIDNLVLDPVAVDILDLVAMAVLMVAGVFGILPVALPGDLAGALAAGVADAVGQVDEADNLVLNREKRYMLATAVVGE
jgi:cellobiose-specific phosphotransferase system component IIC